ELQSSNEELQSVNEELYTVNSEYQLKLAELADLNDDIANFLSSTLTGIIFVDNRLNIRRYTDYVTTEFSMMDHDIGRSLKFISYHFPTVDITEICDNVLKTLVPDEREITTSKNKVFFMRVAPYRSTENKILGCVITLIDITKQKQGQVRLETTEKKLSIAQEAVEAKSDYLSRIAHEIRMPMGALIGLSKSARQQAGDKKALFDSLDKITETIEYMASIVSDISEASRVEREALENVSEPFFLSELLDNINALISVYAAEAGQQFEMSLDDSLQPYYAGNKTSLQQILVNFLNNSIKYTPRGGAISLKASEAPDKAGGDNKACLCFVISDTGIGIEEDFIPKMFNPFTRQSAGDENEDSSMGLGLSIAHNLIRSMNGDVTVESEVGKGSTFTIHVMLDRYDPEQGLLPSSLGAAEWQQLNLEGRNILVAEDNALNRTILCELLLNEGMTCTEAADGEAAVKAYLEAPDNSFDCILMDMRMPKLDGIRATVMIRDSEKPDAHTIPIIGVSANGFSDDINKAMLAGITEYTTKPIDRDKLLLAMNATMNQR
ncbi:MAG: ATP-binding protein, partial [Syntrophomonadaceae bacterium]|nr:ATP-binding protein [Syntrophomonadaceae bacterium]